MAVSKGNLLYEIAQKLLAFMEEKNKETLSIIVKNTDMNDIAEKHFLEQTKKTMDKYMNDMKSYLKDKESISIFIETALLPLWVEHTNATTGKKDYVLNCKMIFSELKKQQIQVMDKLAASGQIDRNPQILVKMQEIFKKQEESIVKVTDYFSALCDVYTLKE